MNLQTRPSLGFPGAVQPNFKKDDHKEDDEPESVFGKVMILFFKKQKSKVTEVETFLRQTHADCRTLSAYFGFEEGRKWEEVLMVFYQFRESFQKAIREMRIKRQKEQRKQSQNEKKSQLAGLIKNRPKKEEVVKKFNFSPDSPNGDGGQQSAAQSKSGAQGKGKASAMYAAYKNSQKQGASHSKKTWV